MALIKTIEEIKDQVGINSTNTIKNVMMDIEDIEESHIVPVLGRPQYDALHSAYNTQTEQSPMGGFLLELWKKTIKALINLAYAQNIDIAQVQVTDRGIVKQNDSAYQYQKIDVQKYFQKKGFNGIEALILFLEENKVNFPLWANNDAVYSITKQFFINTAAQFNKEYSIGNSRRTFMALWPAMKKAEAFYIEETIGTDLFDAIKNYIKTGEPASADNDQLLDKFIRPALAHLTIFLAINELNLEITADGVMINEVTAGNGTSKTSKMPSDTRLEIKRYEAEKTGLRFIKNLKDYLNKNASATKYQLYFESDLYEAPAGAEPEEDFTDRKIYGAM